MMPIPSALQFQDIAQPRPRGGALPAVVELETVRDPAEFAAMRDEWTALLHASTSDGLFLTWEWLHTWWTRLGDGQLSLIVLRVDQDLVAVAPFVRRRVATGLAGVPLLEFLGTGAVGSDYLDVIVRRGYEALVLRRLADFLAETGVSVRLAQMGESAFGRALARQLVQRGWVAVEQVTAVCPFIDLSARSWDAYLASVGPTHRYNFRRRLRNLTKAFGVSCEWAESEASRRDALAALLNLHNRRWDSRGGSDGLHTPRLVAFHEELSRLAHERKWLRLLVLRLDGRPVAAFYGFRYGRSFLFYQSGFDPSFSRHSVGLVTLGLTIKTAIEERASEYDFLHGNEAYKFLWTNSVRQLVCLELYPPSLRGRAHRAAVWGYSTARKLARAALRGHAATTPAMAARNPESRHGSPGEHTALKNVS